jgi:hypothetical protein
MAESHLRTPINCQFSNFLKEPRGFQDCYILNPGRRSGTINRQAAF